MPFLQMLQRIYTCRSQAIIMGKEFWSNFSALQHDLMLRKTSSVNTCEITALQSNIWVSDWESDWTLQPKWNGCTSQCANFQEEYLYREAYMPTVITVNTPETSASSSAFHNPQRDYHGQMSEIVYTVINHQGTYFIWKLREVGTTRKTKCLISTYKRVHRCVHTTKKAR
jgi:hypothetical protein